MPTDPKSSPQCKFGIVLPEGENDTAGKTAHWSDFVAMATMAEQIGLDSVCHCQTRFPPGC